MMTFRIETEGDRVTNLRVKYSYSIQVCTIRYPVMLRDLGLDVQDLVGQMYVG
jgi:hypothetical protein